MGVSQTPVIFWFGYLLGNGITNDVTLIAKFSNCFFSFFSFALKFWFQLDKVIRYAVYNKVD